MGSKLEGFLRVLGSGLSPQAFQANVGLYIDEKAEESRVAQEGRAEAAGIKKFNVAKTFQALGPLGTAMKRAKAAGDTKAIHDIGVRVKDIAEEFPEHANQIKNTFMAHVGAQDAKRKPTTRLTKLQEQRSFLESQPKTKETQRDIANINNIIGKMETVTGTTKFDPSGLERKTKSKIQDTLIKTQDNLARLGEIKRTFKSEFLTYKTQVGEFITGIKEKAGINLSKADRAKLGEYAKFKRKTFSFLNEYIHDMSGAAVSTQEAKRMVKALQTMQDSPTEFEAKMGDLMSEIEAKQARYEYWAKNGLVNNKTVDKDLRSLEAEFPQDAFVGINKAKEAIARSTDPQAKEKAKARLTQWFEVNGYDPRLLETF